MKRIPLAFVESTIAAARRDIERAIAAIDESGSCIGDDGRQHHFQMLGRAQERARHALRTLAQIEAIAIDDDTEAA